MMMMLRARSSFESADASPRSYTPIEESEKRRAYIRLLPQFTGRAPSPPAGRAAAATTATTTRTPRRRTAATTRTPPTAAQAPEFAVFGFRGRKAVTEVGSVADLAMRRLHLPCILVKDNYAPKVGTNEPKGNKYPKGINTQRE